ncbi:hypothetical protein E3E14_22205 [Streptomyces sp. ICN441]|nr:hypothetical protein E3E14_22205 [Streptomyces sp. ICN441]
MKNFRVWGASGGPGGAGGADGAGGAGGAEGVGGTRAAVLGQRAGPIRCPWTRAGRAPPGGDGRFRPGSEPRTLRR